MDIAAIVLVVSLVVFMAIGIPITFSLGMSSIFAILLSKPLQLSLTATKIFAGADSFPILAVIYFMIAGDLMLQGGLTKRLVALFRKVLGWLPGSMVVISFVTCAFFGAISGSALATTAAIGNVMYPEMTKDDEYPVPFAASVQAVGGTLGTMIPPSLPLILYGCLSGTSVSSLFIATIIPGLLMMLVYILTGLLLAHRSGYGKNDHSGTADDKSLWEVFREAFWALLSPIIILGGIYGGIFTATEAAIVACVYSLLIGVFVYKELDLRTAGKAILSAARSSASVMFLCCCATLFGYCMTVLGLPQMVTGAMTQIIHSPVIFLLGANLSYLLCGMFVDATTAILLVCPLLYPAAAAFGVDLVRFGVITGINLSMGIVTPPFGGCMFVATGLDKRITLEGLYKGVLPYCLAGMVGILLITFVEPLSMFLVNIMR
ncbi:MAG: TRAP transporter large permease [Oscillibacter sp.]|nr:TRAP transporter large permease [Oscillibacter sp.]